VKPVSPLLYNAVSGFKLASAGKVNAMSRVVEAFMVVMIAATAIMLSYNAVQISALGSGSRSGGGGEVSLASGSREVIPKGVPAVYGTELGVSFDAISPYNPQLADSTIEQLANLDRTIKLDGELLQRYIRVTNAISCEYCCGAAAITFSNGEPACGCAHSYAMRGLAKYLLLNHGSEFTDEEILEELGKWKTLFFPAQITAKAAVLEEQGIELNYINLASNRYRGIERGVAGGMVGGC
jgi:hypothetical protein